MKNTWLVGLVILVIVLGGGYYFYTQANQPGAPERSVSRYDPANVTWKTTSLEDDPAMFSPRTQVTLVTPEKSYDLGIHTGSCSEIKSTKWPLLAGEKAGMICWWAGGGEELGLFEENGSLVVKLGQLDEGSEEVAGTRGSFKILVTL